MAPLIRLLLALVLLGLAACARRESAVAAGNRSGTLLVGNSAEPKDLDPQTVTAWTDSRIIFALFEGLAGHDETTGQPVPAVARSWEASADGLTWTFHLDPAARWSNGDPVTAGDFVYAYRRMLTPGFAAEYAYMLHPLRNAQAFNRGQLADPAQLGATAVDERTLRLTLEAPCPWLLSLLAHQSWFPVHRATVEKFGGGQKQGTDWTKPGNLVGNGPFVLREWQPNSRIRVERNAGFRAAGEIKLNAIEFFPIESSATEEAAFRAGQLHLTYTLPPDKIAGYRAETPLRIRADALLNTYYVSFNVTRSPFGNVKVRQALARAIDRTALAEKVMRGGHAPATSLVPPDTAGYTSRTAVPTDFAAARTLLAEAGYPGGRGFPSVEVQIGASPNSRQIYEAIQETWKRELGISVTLAQVEGKTLFANLHALAYHASTAGWVGDYVEPNTFLDLFVTGGGNNNTGWSNAEYDRLIAESQRTPDPAARRELQQRAEAILLDEAPIAPTTSTRQNYLIDPAVRGWKPSLLGLSRYLGVELRK